MGEQAPKTPRVVPPPSYEFHESRTLKGIVDRYRNKNKRLTLENKRMKISIGNLEVTIEKLEAEILELKKEKFAGGLTICDKAGGLTIT